MTLDQAVGNVPCCHPIVDGLTGPGEGAADPLGAVHDGWSVWAPNQVLALGDHQTTQQVPSVDLSARVTDDPSVPGVTLRVEGEEDDPEVKVSEASAAWRVAASGEP